jgi:hypothetical protein
MDIETVFKKISIRGRFAFGVKCIESYVSENKIEIDSIDKLLTLLWEFTESESLHLWDEKISDLNPTNILGVEYEKFPNDFPTIDAAEYKELKKIYQNLYKDLIKLISETIEIGTSNLYGGTGEYSSHSLKPTIEVYKITEKLLLKMPDVNSLSNLDFLNLMVGEIKS